METKSKGLVLRLARIVSLLRAGVEEQFYFVIKKNDFLQAAKIVEYSCALLANSNTSSSSKNKSSLPPAEKLTMDFLIPHRSSVKKLISNEITMLSDISRYKIYPIINDCLSAAVGESFVKGLARYCGVIAKIC